jgi:hypothetical protein
MAYFHLRLVPPRLAFPHDATEAEMEAVNGRADNWRGQVAARMVVPAYTDADIDFPAVIGRT